MAASTASRDYFALVVNALRDSVSLIGAGKTGRTTENGGTERNKKAGGVEVRDSAKGTGGAEDARKDEGNKKIKRIVNATRLNFFMWERLAYDRDETFEILAPWLNDKIDLITIQLSENALDLTTFEADLT